MLDIKLIRDESDRARRGIALKGADAALIDQVLELDTRVRKLKTDTEGWRAEQKAKSKEFGEYKKQGKDPGALQQVVNDLKSRIASGDEELAAVEAKLQGLLDIIPNVPHPDVPPGRTADDNVEKKRWGELPAIKDAKPHWEVGKRFGFEVERGSAMSGSGFQMFIGPLARLERALTNFFIDHNRGNGYTEVFCPYVVRRDALYGTGQIPKFEDDLYKLERDGLYMIPTAETPLTNIHAGEILAESDLPRKYTAYTPCWRREAGSAGQDTRGIIRVHQFSKVEMMEFAHPANSYKEHEAMVRHAEELLEALELPYRRMLICGGDSSFSNAKQYDLEVYAAGLGRWLEVSSVSNFESFQARRCKARYKDSATGKNEFVHTLNGSGLALPRVMIGLLENNQRPDGSVPLPAALHDYYGSKTL